MKPYRNILAIADPQLEGSWGLQRAGQLARISDARLHLRSFCHHPGIAAVHAVSPSVADLARKELMHEQQGWLEREADTLRASVSEVRPEVIWGTPVQDQIVREVLALKPDLVVKDVEAVPTLKRLFFTPLDWHLLRLCPAPLLLVQRAPQRPPRDVVAAVDVGADFPDAGELNDEVLHAARQLAGLNDAKVGLVHAFEGVAPPLAGAVAGLAVPESVYQQLRDDRVKRFEDFANRHGVAKAQRHLLDGVPDLALTGFVQDSGADVMVMGSVHRTGLERILVGSTAERILSQLHCDVLVLKPRRYAEMIGQHFGPDRAP